MGLISIDDYRKIVFFTGAGMSRESGVPTYRGKGGIWNEYHPEEYACQAAFDRDPEKVLHFHELRRIEVDKCVPHEGYTIITKLQEKHSGITIITQNIDGLHRKAGNTNILELHGNLWRTSCACGIRENFSPVYTEKKCPVCGSWLRPDIVWFGDNLDSDVMQKAADSVAAADLFISIGTSGVVWPAAGFQELASKAGALMAEINPEQSPFSSFYKIALRTTAGEGLKELFS